MQRAYTEKNFYNSQYRCFIETPSLNRWIQLDNYAKNEKEAVDWLEDLGYRVVTKVESYERQKQRLT